MSENINLKTETLSETLQLTFDFTDGSPITRNIQRPVSPPAPTQAASKHAPYIPKKQIAGINMEAYNKILKEYNDDLIDKKIAADRLRAEANYPVFLGVDKILIDKVQRIQTITEKTNQIELQEQNTKPELSLDEIRVKNNSDPTQETITSIPEFESFGAWTDFNSRLSLKERENFNKQAAEILEKPIEKIDSSDLNILRRYSGFGGIDDNKERGVLYDFYTSPPIAFLTWQLLNKTSTGIKDGDRILEPSCGTGVFFQQKPNKDIHFTGVELDVRTAKVASCLSNKRTEIINSSFEAFNLSGKAGNFDYVIGNAPFGERAAQLSSLDMPDEKILDNYFVSRCIDNLKENGTMALITASGVLANKTNEEFRLNVSKKAQLAGALKLPDRSFHHTHTQVMPDILLFRKLPDDIRLRMEALSDEEFKNTPFYNSEFVEGAYFDKHPENIAGEISKGTGQWGNDEVKGGITKENLEKIIHGFVPANPMIFEEQFDQIRERYKLPEAKKQKEAIPLTETELKQLEKGEIRHGKLKIKDDKTYILSSNHLWNLAADDKEITSKIRTVRDISETAAAIKDYMIVEREKIYINNVQSNCKALLESYVEKYKSLPVDDPDIQRFVRSNPAVQGIYEAFLLPTDPLLTQENIYRKKGEVYDGHSEAVQALLALRSKMKDGTEENLRKEFPENHVLLLAEMRSHNDIFLTADRVYQLREDFIAGDAWQKIDGIKIAAEKADIEDKELLLRGAAELEKAVGWTPIEDADFTPRSSWIPTDIIQEWITSEEGLNKPGSLKGVAKNNEGKWGMVYNRAWQEYGDPVIYYLNGQRQRSKNIDTDAFNKEHDDLFKSYISNHEEYRSRLENEYNRKFKTHIIAPVKTYPVEITGWRSESQGGKNVKPHQWQSIHHLYRNQCGISALGTGYGKTVTSIALMSLLKQEGKAHRVFLQVPNNKVKDWIEEIRDVMPSLKIASIDPEEKGYSSREKRYAKYQAMARSDADIIIMPESSASEIQLSPENDQRVTEQIAFNYGLEKADKSARQQVLAMQKGENKAKSGKTNVTISFEDFGCNALIVDEAHRYKNLFSSTLSRETGMNDGRQSAKAMSLFKKSEYIREQNKGKNVFLLTATPLTNSPLEYYNMIQYIAPHELEKMGVSTIDGFIREFANIEQSWLYDWSSGQAKQGNILTGFKNLPTLQNLFFAYTDLQNNPEAIGLDKPTAENKPHVIPLNQIQMDVVKEISEELESYKRMSAEDRLDLYPGQNFLTFYTKMRTASLDLELFDPVNHKDWKNPKLETLSKNAYENYQKTKGGQVIFCDRVFSSDADFNIHEKIKQQLSADGFKEKDIVIVNGFTKSGGNKSDGAIEKEVSKATADYNAGKYKMIIGSTACIGEGLNLQKNSSQVHHFDIPFRPSDFIQRNGRVDRQGNEQKTVTLNTYLAAGTIDNYSVNLVQRKANWIDQLLRTKSDVFTNPDDENSIDADELLLSLTEEWGDKEKAKERKAELERQKQEKIKEAQTKQMKTHLKSLSLAIGSIQPLKDKNSKEYKKRETQINNLEAALKQNPVFTKHEILGKKEPFLYGMETNTIFRKGDIIVNAYDIYQVESFNFKKQKITLRELSSNEMKEERQNRMAIYGRKTDESDSYRDFSVSDLCGTGNSRGWYNSRNKALFHLEKAGKETAELIRNTGSKSFYDLPEEIKEKYYSLHTLVSHEHNGSSYNSVYFSINKDGQLKIDKREYQYNNDDFINPFSKEGKEKITNALDIGLEYNKWNKEETIKTLSEIIPELKKPIENKIMQIEQEQEMQTEMLKVKFVNKAEAALNANANRTENRVHVVRARI